MGKREGGRKGGTKSRRNRKGRGHTSASGYVIARGFNRREEAMGDSNDQVNMMKINIYMHENVIKQHYCVLLEYSNKF